MNVVSIYTRIWSVCWLLNAKQGSHCPWTAAFSGKQTEKRGLGRRSEESHVPLQNQLLRPTTNAVSSDQLPSHTRVHACKRDKPWANLFMCKSTTHTKFCEEVASMEIQIWRSHFILCVCRKAHKNSYWSEPTLKYILPYHHRSLKYCHVHLFEDFEEHTLLLSLGNIWLKGFLLPNYHYNSLSMSESFGFSVSVQTETLFKTCWSMSVETDSRCVTTSLLACVVWLFILEICAEWNSLLFLLLRWQHHTSIDFPQIRPNNKSKNMDLQQHLLRF